MQGFAITYFSHQGRTIDGTPVSEWLFQCGKALKLSGATVQGALCSYGHDSGFHSENLYDNYDQPVQVTFIVTQEEKAKLTAAVDAAGAKLFYTLHAVEFGHTQ